MTRLTDDELVALQRRLVQIDMHGYWVLSNHARNAVRLLLDEVREFRKMKAQLADDHSSVSKTPYVDPVYGNDITGVPGDPNKPFATYEFAEQAMRIAAMERAK